MATTYPGTSQARRNRLVVARHQRLYDLSGQTEAILQWVWQREGLTSDPLWLRAATLQLSLLVHSDENEGSRWSNTIGAKFLKAAVGEGCAETMRRGQREFIRRGYFFRVDVPTEDEPDNPESWEDEVHGGLWVLAPNASAVLRELRALPELHPSRRICALPGCTEPATVSSPVCSERHRKARSRSPAFRDLRPTWEPVHCPGPVTESPQLGCRCETCASWRAQQQRKRSSSARATTSCLQATVADPSAAVAPPKGTRSLSSTALGTSPRQHQQVLPVGGGGSGEGGGSSFTALPARTMNIRLYALPGLQARVHRYEARVRRLRAQGRDRDRQQRWESALPVVRLIIAARKDGVMFAQIADTITGGRLAEAVQNIPGDLRAYIGVGSDNSALSFDGKAMHAFIAAVLSGDEAFLTAVRNDGYVGLAEVLVPGWTLPRELAKNGVVLPWLNRSSPRQLLDRLLEDLAELEAKGEWTPSGTEPPLTYALVKAGHEEFQRRYRALSNWKKDMVRQARETKQATMTLPNGDLLVVPLGEKHGKQKAARKILAAIFLSVETLIVAPAQSLAGWPCLDMHDGFLLAVPAIVARREMRRCAELLDDSARQLGFPIPVKAGLGESWAVAEKTADVM